MTNQLTSSEALARLKAGNERYVSDEMRHPRQGKARRQELTGGQAPFAVVLGCADSRVSPTLLFDQGLGDLFVIRVAGNIADDIVLGSIEFAVHALASPLIVVLGHAQCGAVEATVDGQPLPGHLPALTKAIQPAVDSVAGAPGDLLENAVRANARLVADQLRASVPILAKASQAGKLQVAPAYYHLDSGAVEFLL